MEQAEQYAHQGHDSDADGSQHDAETLAQAAGFRSPAPDKGTASAADATPPSGSMGQQRQLTAAQLELWPQAEEDLKVLPVPDRWAGLTVNLHNWGLTGSLKLMGSTANHQASPHVFSFGKCCHAHS